MAEKDGINENVASNSFPLKMESEAVPNSYVEPPAYENPQIDFSSGWKDRFFGIAFWLHAIVVVLIGSILGAPAAWSLIKVGGSSESAQVWLNPTNIKIFLCGIFVATVVGGMAAFLTLLFLQQCAGHIVRWSFVILMVILLPFGIIFAFLFWPLCFIPGIFLFIVLIYFLCVKGRIAFAEAHLEAGFAALRSNPSLIPVTFVIFLAEFLWFIFWCLMVLGLYTTLINSSKTDRYYGDRSPSTTISFGRTNEEPVWMKTNTSAFAQGNNKNGSMIQNEQKWQNTLDIFSQRSSKKKATERSGSSADEQMHPWIRNTVMFFLFLSWYWGANTFSYIAHFIAACTVGKWWFPDEVNEQYTMKTSIQRAFTTNFGTICLGSLLEAILKAARSTANNNRRSILSCIFMCIVAIIEKVIGYLNIWAFIFSALTGQGFVKASRSFLDLFTKRGWTAIINDSIVSTTLGILSFGIGLTSAAAGGILVYLLGSQYFNNYAYIFIAASVSFLIGIFMSSVITTIVTSCVRTVFVCFAMNPATLGATHPDYLQKLSKVWHKYYPEEFANSGYANQFTEHIV